MEHPLLIQVGSHQCPVLHRVKTKQGLSDPKLCCNRPGCTARAEDIEPPGGPSHDLCDKPCYVPLCLLLVRVLENLFSSLDKPGQEEAPRKAVELSPEFTVPVCFLIHVHDFGITQVKGA